MKKTLTVLALILAVCLAMTSCENGLPEGLVNLMGGMGNNLIGVDKSKVEETVKNASVNKAEKDSDGTISFGDYSVNVSGSELKFTVGEKEVSFNLPAGHDELLDVETFITPSENMSEIVSALESNAGSEIREKLQEKVSEEDKAAVEGTVTLLNAAFDAVGNETTDEKTKEVLDVLKDNLVEPEGGYTKADALVLQALTNLVFATVNEVGDGGEEVDPGALVDSINDPFMELKSISDNSGSNIQINFEQLMAAIQK